MHGCEVTHAPRGLVRFCLSTGLLQLRRQQAGALPIVTGTDCRSTRRVCAFRGNSHAGGNGQCQYPARPGDDPAIRRLAGRLVPTRKGQTPSFDDKLSYVVEVSSAEIGVTTASLTHMMNTYVFGEADAPLKHLRLSVHGSQIKQEGTIKKGIGIPFETIGDVSPTAEGKIRIHPTKMKAGHLPVKGLMKLFGWIWPS